MLICWTELCFCSDWQVKRSPSSVFRSDERERKENLNGEIRLFEAQRDENTPKTMNVTRAEKNEEWWRRRWILWNPLSRPVCSASPSIVLCLFHPLRQWKEEERDWWNERMNGSPNIKGHNAICEQFKHVMCPLCKNNNPNREYFFLVFRKECWLVCDRVIIPLSLLRTLFLLLFLLLFFYCTLTRQIGQATD